MNKYLTTQIQKTFQSLRKEARENFYLSFHRAYIASLILVVILGVLYVWTLNANANSGYQMSSIESVRREKQQEKHFLRAQIAHQESQPELNIFNDRLVEIAPGNISYVVVPR